MANIRELTVNEPVSVTYPNDEEVGTELEDDLWTFAERRFQFAPGRVRIHMKPVGMAPTGLFSRWLIYSVPQNDNAPWS
jgi:hypothetical protein